jgi:CheY-like chemotaxis protein
VAQGLDSLPFLDLLRHAGAGGRIVLIALTGWGQDEDREPRGPPGLDRHLIKPVRPDDLLRLIQEIDASRKRRERLADATPTTCHGDAIFPFR